MKGNYLENPSGTELGRIRWEATINFSSQLQHRDNQIINPCCVAMWSGTGEDCHVGI